MDVNVASMFLTCRAVVPVMRAHGGGKIVNISSGTPFRGVPFLLHYVTSKGAIVALTRALAKELGKDNVLVNCVAPGFTMSAGVEAHPEVVEKLRDVSVAARTIQRDQVPGRRRRRGRLPLRSRLGLRHRPDDRHRRRPDLPLILALDGSSRRRRDRPGDHVVYDVDARRGARSARRRVDGRALVWELTERPRATWLLRCDRVDFPPGGVAYLHTHPGPGPARPAHGRIRIDTQGTSHEYGPFEWWYETGPDPGVRRGVGDRGDRVRARARAAARSGRASGRSRYVDPADEEKPKLQRARDLPRAAVCEPRSGGKLLVDQLVGPRRRARVLRSGRELPRAARRALRRRRSG